MAATPPAYSVLLTRNPERRALPDGWITRYDDKCVSTAPAPLPELTLALLLG